MGRRKAVVSADGAAMAEVERLVREGKYASVSEFVREAVSEKLSRLRRTRLEEQVARYCTTPDERDAEDLVPRQAYLDDQEG
jgi:Arc/MetJ-type ribon-helix-helix transcriptional regulator